jgi:hypothetical protein
LAARVPKPSLEILYKKVIQRTKNGIMDLDQFFEACEELASQVFIGELSSLEMLIDLIEKHFTDMLPNCGPSYARPQQGKKK